MLIYAASLLIWAFTVSPILTVLIYHFRMYSALADAELFGGGAYRRLVLNYVFRQLTGALFNVRIQIQHSPL